MGLKRYRRNNIHIMGPQEGEEKEKETQSIFKSIMTENFLNLGREMDIQDFEAQWAPGMLNLKRVTLRHIIYN